MKNGSFVDGVHAIRSEIDKVSDRVTTIAIAQEGYRVNQQNLKKSVNNLNISIGLLDASISKLSGMESRIKNNYRVIILLVGLHLPVTGKIGWDFIVKYLQGFIS